MQADRGVGDTLTGSNFFKVSTVVFEKHEKF